MPDINVLIDSVQKYITLSIEDKALVYSHFKNKKVKKIKRRELLLREGDVQQYYIFVISGCVRSYSIDKSCNEHILQFATTGWWIGDLYSLKNNEPSRLFIETITESNVLLISKLELSKLFENIPKLETYFRILAEYAFGTAQRRLIEHLGLSSLERYLNFKDRYPDVYDIVPKKFIASYIGVSPEFLSKMLKQMRE
ncbi:MAG: cAMP-binding protein [Sphingobacterium sp.]|jgi:CRP-like cAMP-binding protein|nr:cAMP-binding protein [Sphingobacterium sp.]